jgi:CheY-like chemotaxis protein/GAF domain-containing protein
VPKVVCIQSEHTGASATQYFDPSVELTVVSNPTEALLAAHQESIDGIYFAEPADSDPPQLLQAVIENAITFDLVPLGIAILDSQNLIKRCNRRLIDWFSNRELIGHDFYESLGNPTILNPDDSVLATDEDDLSRTGSMIEVDDRFFQLLIIPLLDAVGKCQSRIVTLIDCTCSMQQRQKLEALHLAGTALADLRPEEIYQMDVIHRVELLKENILFYTRDLLNFDVVEIRVLEEETGLLVPLLSVGIEAVHSKRPMYAQRTGNGVTGFVAATGKSYLCADTTHDDLYMDGLIGAKSSLTVPLIYHDNVIGSFNVESPEINAFTESDLHFVESFARDIAVALNTLELLNAQQANTALQSVEAIHSAVATPIDEILNDTVHAIDSYRGDDEAVIDRLREILRNAREIKQVIHRVGEQFAPEDKVPASIQTEMRPKLRGKRILVIDADDEVRTSAHCLLERYDCIVETAHEGREAILMIRNSGLTNAYDAIIADIKLPDIGGYDLLMQLKELVEEPPLILMTGYGYDPGHSIVKARQAGLRTNAVLFKPFRLDQLLETVESTVSATETASS